MKTKFCAAGLLLALGLSAQAGIYTYGDGSVNTVIPDNSTIGLAESLSVSTEPPRISSAILSFTLAGGSGTDLSGYLRLGNLPGSVAYNLTPTVQADSVINGSGVTFNVDVTSLFMSQNPNDTWTLFFADTVPGDITTLNNGWSLDIEAVPEPVNVALGIFGGLMGLVILTGSGRVKRFFGRKTEM